MSTIYTDLSNFIDDVASRAAVTFYYGSSNQAVIGYAGIYQLVIATFIDTACSYIPGQSTSFASNLATDIYANMQKLKMYHNQTLYGVDIWWEWIDQNINLPIEVRVLEVRQQLGGSLSSCNRSAVSPTVYNLS